MVMNFFITILGSIFGFNLVPITPETTNGHLTISPPVMADAELDDSNDSEVVVPWLDDLRDGVDLTPSARYSFRKACYHLWYEHIAFRGDKIDMAKSFMNRYLAEFDSSTKVEDLPYAEMNTILRYREQLYKDLMNKYKRELTNQQRKTNSFYKQLKCYFWYDV